MRRVLYSPILNTDDTPIRVVEVGGPGTHRGHIWVYVGRGQHAGTVYDFSPNWAAEHPASILASYEGYLQSDGYAGYLKLCESGTIIGVGCNAHARRYFHQARSSDWARAHLALAFYRRLYKIEKSCKGLSAQEREAVRKQKAKPILEKLKAWLDEQAPLVLPRSPIGEAITYARNHWIALTRYVEDGELDIDYGEAERALRGIAVGRSNWLFAGSDEGGHRAAVIYSFVQTCKQLSIEPFQYFRDVLARLPEHPHDRLEELLPHEWKSNHEPRPPDESS